MTEMQAFEFYPLNSEFHLIFELLSRSIIGYKGRRLKWTIVTKWKFAGVNSPKLIQNFIFTCHYEKYFYWSHGNGMLKSIIQFLSFLKNNIQFICLLLQTYNMNFEYFMVQLIFTTTGGAANDPPSRNSFLITTKMQK